MNSSDAIRTPVSPLSDGTSEAITLRLRIPLPPSFKNSKRSILDKNTGRQRTLTPGPIKRRMDHLENAIVLALFSLSRTSGAETPSECLKRLRTVLSGLCDDSIKEIPTGDWDVKYVEKSEEGLILVIHELPDVPPMEAAQRFGDAYAQVVKEERG